MTVDDRLRAAHARIPEPDEATIARARARLERGDGRGPGRGRGRTPLRRRRRRRRRAARSCRLAARSRSPPVAAVAVLPRDAERVPAPPAKPAGAPVTLSRATRST